MLGLLSVPVEQSLDVSRAQSTARLLEMKIIPDICALPDTISSDVRIAVVKVVILLISRDRSKSATHYCISLVCQWHSGPSIWKSAFDEALQTLVGILCPTVIYWFRLMSSPFQRLPAMTGEISSKYCPRWSKLSLAILERH